MFTVIGLDRDGAQLNDASGGPVSYGMAGLPPSTELRLVVWNSDGASTLSTTATVTTDPLGVAYFAVPLHAIWALTTHPIDE